MKSLPPSCEQCFEQFKIALEDLRLFVGQENAKTKSVNHSRELITDFEVTHELALKVIKTYLKNQGKGPFSGSRDLTIEAFHADLIDDGKGWLDMVIDRIKYNPIYDLNTQKNFLDNICHKYIQLLEKFEDTMEKKLY
ncbi:MAG: nucleotidyltransferase substrate binding protein [Algoriphagus sp.]|uniref:HI0074 family nucleotidyltransferase substrate-binding subunit n=1 Tax=Algoriphagus sp. TaxID=1872435 RepID=UPI0018549922|nr:HI0074 family nucleotidyltransferase substrate-binding subunit [Algoriphagus sp.]NVJ85934.1 nucleotidyltransferase substrate binding protein [Algoriphagus sp.]